MTDERRSPPHRTHEVLNQVPALAQDNLVTGDAALREALAREGAAWALPQVTAFGALAAGEPQRWAAEANAHRPVLRTFDRQGRRVDEVEYTRGYHDLLGLAVEHGIHASPWRRPKPGAHVARAGLFYLLSEVDAGVCCPVSMTYSSIPALAAQPDLAREWVPRFTALGYDGSLRPATDKPGALCGMAMTEKQGGSDVQANTTRARAIGLTGGPGAEYELTGHKWFCSAPMSDAFLTLARTDAGLSCFFLPRFLPDGTKNRLFVQRLKDKLGNHSNASSEVEFDGTWARMVGEEGRGVRTIIEMVAHTRLDCVLGAAATMRAAVVQATHHASYRSAFGTTLIDAPLMRNVLADLCVESEAATMLAMRLARAYDEGASDPAARAFARIATAVAKYWVTKRVPPLVAEALECLGGNGYVEDSGMPRLYREAPLNSIWEGSGNVICLDVLRALSTSPAAKDAFVEEVLAARGVGPDLDSYLTTATSTLVVELADPGSREARARHLVERMALVLQGALLVRYGDPDVAAAFCRSRLGGDGGLAFGTLPAGIDHRRIIDRSRPS